MNSLSNAILYLPSALHERGVRSNLTLKFVHSKGQGMYHNVNETSLSRATWNEPLFSIHKNIKNCKLLLF